MFRSTETLCNVILMVFVILAVSGCDDEEVGNKIVQPESLPMIARKVAIHETVTLRSGKVVRWEIAGKEYRLSFLFSGRFQDKVILSSGEVFMSGENAFAYCEFSTPDRNVYQWLLYEKPSLFFSEDGELKKNGKFLFGDKDPVSHPFIKGQKIRGWETGSYPSGTSSVFRMFLDKFSNASDALVENIKAGNPPEFVNDDFFTFSVEVPEGK